MSGSGEALYRAMFVASPTPALLLDTDLVIVDVNESYGLMLDRARDELVGRHVFEAFPDSSPAGSGAGRLETSMRTALSTGRPDRLPALSYAVQPSSGSGDFDERWWTVVNIPLLDDDGRAIALLNVTENITDVVREQNRSRLAQAMADDLQRRSASLTSDLAERSQALSEVHQTEARASRRLAALAEVALELAAAETVEQLTTAVVERGLAVLGADGGAVGVVLRDRTRLRLTTTDSLGPDTRRVFGEVPLDGPLPAAVAARTGRRVLLPDRRAGLAFSSDMAEVYATTGRDAWAAVPLRVADQLLGSVTVCWESPQDFSTGDIELLSAFGAQCAQALDRLLRRQDERATAADAIQLSQALQLSLLTEPVQPDHLEITARYVPAAHEAQVGGDWYDAFYVSDGSTQLVIGDVAGHDRDAAAAMAQVRNVLRGISHTLVEPPARVLSALDRAMDDLAIGAMSTAVLAKVEQTEADARRGLRTLRWSDAGHPPPLLIDPAGGAQLLERRPDLVLGAVTDAERHDHTTALSAGATVLFYTDGLVERRTAPLDEGLEWLRGLAEDLAARGLTLDELCDALLHHLDGDIEDDVALLAVRVHPEDRARPAEAGPSVLPADLRDETA